MITPTENRNGEAVQLRGLRLAPLPIDTDKDVRYLKFMQAVLDELRGMRNDFQQLTQQTSRGRKR